MFAGFSLVRLGSFGSRHNCSTLDSVRATVNFLGSSSSIVCSYISSVTQRYKDPKCTAGRMSGAASEGKDEYGAEGDAPPPAVQTKIAKIIEDVELGRGGTYCKYGRKVICTLR